jgi:hypothetical protein
MSYKKILNNVFFLFFLLLPIFVVLGVTYLLYLGISYFIENVDSLSIGNISPWFIFIPIGLVLIWLVYKYWSSIFPSKPSSGGNWKKFRVWWKTWKFPKWVKGLIWIVLSFLALWFLVGYLAGIKNLSKSSNNISESYDNNSGVSVKNYPKLNMNGQNVMKAGEFKKFTIEYDGPTISWDVAGSDTVSLYFEKSEDKTRNWQLKIWRDKKGIKQYKFYPYKPPILAALVGTVYIKTERDAIVIVSTK